MFGWIIGLILVVVIFVILGKGGIFQKNTGTTESRNRNSSAMETLKDRYAKGEIDSEEFNKIKEDIKEDKK